MPFTFAHPAAVLPLLRRTWAVPAALVIGAMVPDVEYFVLLRAQRTISHTVPGVLLQGLPVGLALYWLWAHLWRAYAVALWPLLARLVGVPAAPEPPVTLRLLARIAASIVLGAFTHLLWDAATHEHGALVERIPALSATWLTLGTESISGYRVLQHGSTVLGFAALLAYSVRRVRRSTPTPAGRLAWGSVAALLALAAGATCTALAWTPRPLSRADLVHAALAGITAFIAAFTIGALWRQRSARDRA